MVAPIPFFEFIRASRKLEQQVAELILNESLTTDQRDALIGEAKQAVEAECGEPCMLGGRMIDEYIYLEDPPQRIGRNGDLR